MAPTNPSTGQKVTPSQPPTTTPHSHGEIDPSSLAAESLRAQGAFSSNAGASPGDQPATSPGAHAPGSTNKPHSGLEAQESYGGTAPSYVNAQFRVDDGGAKGKNLTEGGFAGSGTGGGRLPEPGSKNDPGRAGLEGFVEGGKKVGGGGVKEEGQFGVLKSEEA
ncbi:hypothetical protein B0T16DRAFT_198025 [Cercophora newfieldiana]|uniref:Uncharacterized protein n=1 Tax=Cercophora newfieldiana TaxID=92897 RepID=A0AA40CMK9_9PEZI|nr:hypothetical protein B0T16DRAFT_198025 [Cercophora newfieldiana]